MTECGREAVQLPVDRDTDRFLILQVTLSYWLIFLLLLVVGRLNKSLRHICMRTAVSDRRQEEYQAGSGS